VKPNIGIGHALIRITLGLVILSWTNSRLSRRLYQPSIGWFMLWGAFMVAEGIVRYCPVTALYNNLLKNREKEMEGA